MPWSDHFLHKLYFVDSLRFSLYYLYMYDSNFFQQKLYLSQFKYNKIHNFSHWHVLKHSSILYVVDNINGRLQKMENLKELILGYAT